MSTRAIHKVAVTNPPGTPVASAMMSATVVVADVVTVLTTTGKEIAYSVRPSSAAPYILDNTGDFGTTGDPNSCSRASHIERLTGAADPTQSIDQEVLDGIALLPTNAGDELALIMPLSGAAPLIVDNTGSGMGSTPDNPTRACHVAAIYEQSAGGSTNSDDGASSSDPGNTGRFLLTLRTDAAAFQLTSSGKEVVILVNKSNQEPIDNTQYDTDGNPPLNSDPNPYIVWAPETAGPWLGAGVATNQGLLWWIESLKAGGGYYVLISIDGELALTPNPTVLTPTFPSGTLIYQYQQNAVNQTPDVPSYFVYAPYQEVSSEGGGVYRGFTTLANAITFYLANPGGGPYMFDNNFTGSETLTVFNGLTASGAALNLSQADALANQINLTSTIEDPNGGRFHFTAAVGVYDPGGGPVTYSYVGSFLFKMFPQSPLTPAISFALPALPPDSPSHAGDQNWKPSYCTVFSPVDVSPNFNSVNPPVDLFTWVIPNPPPPSDQGTEGNPYQGYLWLVDSIPGISAVSATTLDWYFIHTNHLVNPQPGDIDGMVQLYPGNGLYYQIEDYRLSATNGSGGLGQDFNDFSYQWSVPTTGQPPLLTADTPYNP